MYKTPIFRKTTIRKNDTVEGETIEQKVERIINNGEPIKDGAPTIYTDRKDGVLPAYDPRTDRFEVAIEGMDKITKTRLAEREERINKRTKPKEDGKPESTAGTDNKE